MSAKLRLPRDLRTATLIVALLAFGALTLALSVAAATPAASPELAARPVHKG